jgi:predicted nuclease of predicted toxin-antitoxin system
MKSLGTSRTSSLAATNLPDRLDWAPFLTFGIDSILPLSVARGRAPPGKLMRFSIDECLHTSPVTLAHHAGYACEHVNFLGMGGYKDWQLMARIRDEEFTLITNNRTDFAALYGREDLHAGLVIIIPNVVPVRQCELFRTALAHIGGRSMVNTVLEIDVVGASAICREYLCPGP